MIKGTIVKALAGFYYVRDKDGSVYAARARGIFKKNDMSPLVGDETGFSITHEQDMEAVIEEILPRKNSFVRPPIANVDMFIIVVAAASPDPNKDIIDRLLVMAEEADTDIAICLNKIDIADSKKSDDIEKTYEDIYPLIKTDAKSGKGMSRLKEVMAGNRVAFAGASGVGKSTIIKKLASEAEIKTGSVSEKTARGRHTTRHVELFDIEEKTQVFDTPGFTSFDILNAGEEELQYLFPEMRPYIGSCKFDNCRHLKEPGCSVTKAVKAGLIGKSRYASYVAGMQAIKERDSF